MGTYLLNCWVLIINDWQEIPAFAGMTRYFFRLLGQPPLGKIEKAGFMQTGGLLLAQHSEKLHQVKTAVIML